MYESSGYFSGIGGQYMPVNASPQGQGLAFSQLSTAGGTPSWMGPRPAQTLGTAPGQSAYGAIGQSPAWLQQYMTNSQHKEGQQGYYDPTLQMRDIQSAIRPEMRAAMGQYGQQFYNPAFAQNSRFTGSDQFRQGGAYDPFASSPWNLGQKSQTRQMGIPGMPQGMYEQGRTGDQYYNPFSGAKSYDWNPWASTGTGYVPPSAYTPPGKEFNTGTPAPIGRPIGKEDPGYGGGYGL